MPSPVVLQTPLENVSQTDFQPPESDLAIGVTWIIIALPATYRHSKRLQICLEDFRWKNTIEKCGMDKYDWRQDYIGSPRRTDGVHPGKQNRIRLSGTFKGGAPAYIAVSQKNSNFFAKIFFLRTWLVSKKSFLAIWWKIEKIFFLTFLSDNDIRKRVSFKSDCRVSTAEYSGEW